MKTLTIAAPKGGSAKSLTTATLAVRAAEDGSRVAMLDLNADQATLTQWWALRGRQSNPYLLSDCGRLAEDIELLRGEGFAYCMIDTPPLDMELIETAIVVSDAVLVPVMASFFDVSAIDSVVDMCKRRRKPFAFVLSSFDGRQIFKSSNDEAVAVLSGRGKILKTRVPYHPKFRAGQIEGKTGPELDKKLADTVNELWAEVQTLMASKRG